MLRKTCILTFVAVALVLFAPSPLGAQTNGEPLISTGGTSFNSSPSYIDAYIETGGATSTNNDVCLRIQSVYNSTLIPAGGSAVVDARGFNNNNYPSGSGGWVCSVDPFAITANTGLVGKSGVLLLGFIDIPAQVTWVIPTRTIVQGIGGNGVGLFTNGGGNTVIHAASSFAEGLGSTTAVLQMGLGGTSSSHAAISFGIQIRDLSVDCNATESGSGATVGVLNNNSEEQSVLNNVEIFDCPTIGLHVTTNNLYSTGIGAVNSGPYEDVSINFTTNCGACTSTTIGLQVDGDTTSGTSGENYQGRSIRGFDNFTVSGNQISGTKPTLIYIFGVSTTVTSSHVEYCSGVCIQVGQTTPSYSTYGVRLSDITVGVNNGGYDVEIAAGTSTYPTGNILVENLNHETFANTNTLKDNVTGYAAGDSYLGWYYLGRALRQPFLPAARA